MFLTLIQLKADGLTCRFTTFMPPFLCVLPTLVCCEVLSYLRADIYMDIIKMPTYVGYSGATTKCHCIYGRPPVFLRFDKYTQYHDYKFRWS